MSTSIIIISSLVYLLLLFLIAYLVDAYPKKGKKLVDNPYTYALSLAVYCTAWTFYGSVGKAASPGGITFLCTYIGPVLIAPLWIFILKKIIRISKSQGLTSIADFISSRYGKSTRLGVVVTLVSFFGIVPYISIQLKAVSSSFGILTNEGKEWNEALNNASFYDENAFIIAVILTIFTIFFGTRKLDPNERHGGLVAAIAFESIWKLFAFLAIGIFVTYGIYNGFGDLFSKAYAHPEISSIFSFKESEVDSWTWTWLIILSMTAILFLPRQFHVAVVENKDANYVDKAAWLFPLYLLLINIFVVPIACGGLLQFPGGEVEADNFVLSLPLYYGKDILALIVYLGGLSAATSMVVVAIIALSIMISNNLVIPLLIRTGIVQEQSSGDLSSRLITIRRISIIVIMLVAYIYFKAVGAGFSLVSIGLISFAAIAQFMPVMLGALYWKEATEKGAMAGLLTGAFIWVVTLAIPTMAEVGLLSENIITEGYFGFSVLKPYALFGMESSDHIAHAAFWSLLLNTGMFIGVSLNTVPKQIEITQANLFVDIKKYTKKGSEYELVKREAQYRDIENLLHRFLGKKTAQKILTTYAKSENINLEKLKTANAQLVNLAESHLAGAIGTASAKFLLASVVKEDPISLEEMLSILDETHEVIQYSKALEKKSEELLSTTQQLKAANEQLKNFDRLKADFITTVTHELRTPITSIKALSKILSDNKDLDTDKRTEFLNIIVSESERIARLINQVLDLEKVQSGRTKSDFKVLDFNQLTQLAFKSLKALFKEKNIECITAFPSTELLVEGNADRLTQVVVNLLSNAIKFCDPEEGKVKISLQAESPNLIVLKVSDNGAGIPLEKQQLIFEQFTQLNSQRTGKPAGSGLGLYISQKILKQHRGKISVQSKKNQGATFIASLPLYHK